MKVWALTDGPVREGKYLVVRRDGTTPDWPHFVMAGVDPASPAGLRAYASEARRLGMAEDFCASVEELANQYAALAVRRASDAAVLGIKGADPDKGPHRKDLPVVIAMMRGETDVAALVARAEAAESALARQSQAARALVEAARSAKSTLDTVAVARDKLGPIATKALQDAHALAAALSEYDQAGGGGNSP